ncbi:unnamed protein product [Psylliodes chrysocephalus]|uniref:Uncharacterized protein n=1 Tax=Psylliodes chrysocephalus TaxID=3402493 RepID=A0A9P0D5X0_9CUCU|nr:unnamed protein product [Psylliodes chrysocephala]
MTTLLLNYLKIGSKLNFCQIFHPTVLCRHGCYHNRRLDKAPCSNDIKAIIKDYIVNDDLYFEENYTKKQLLKVLKSYSIKKKYFCDTLAGTYGAQTSSLPLYI